MGILTISFETRVADGGYEIDDLPHGRAIVGRGASNPLRPLDFHDHLYRQFAELDGSERAFVQFVEKFGPVSWSTAGGHQVEPLDAINARWQIMGRMVAARSTGELISLMNNQPAEIVATLEFAGDGISAAFALKPKTLFDAMRIQLMQAKASGADVRSCKQCGSWFEVGRGGKRATSLFCKDSCRTAFHNSQKMASVHNKKLKKRARVKTR